MFLSTELLTSWLQLRLDVLLFGLSIIGLYTVSFYAIRWRGSVYRFSSKIGIIIGVLSLLGAVAAEFGGAYQRTHVAGQLASIAPTYAHEFRVLGHSRVKFNSGPDDPTYLALQQISRDWLRLNPTAGDLFTFRRNADDHVAIVVDPVLSQPPGQLLRNQEGFVRSLAGEIYFETDPRTDERGLWVRAFAPIRDETGRVEAALALGYPAGRFLKAVATVRGLILLTALLLIIAVLTLAAFVGTVRHKLREHTEVQRELHVAKVAADEASRAKSDFLAVMSHEIRTPLNAVMGFATLLSESKLDEAQRGYVATITSEGARLGSLVNDLLDLSKIEEGRLMLERLPFAPTETAHEVLRLLSGRAFEKKIDLRFEAQVAGPLLVAGDPLRFRQVLVNLVDNAIKFTPAGSVTLFVRWNPPDPGQTGGRLAVRVCDTGIGIAPDQLGAIFQKFMQADTSMTRRYGGTGLGLAICQRLVGLMGGSITVESKLGAGTEFAFTLPFQSVALPVETETESPETPVLRDRPARILVVDDMETNRFLLEVFLRRNGFEPDLAAGGEDAIRKAALNRYDAILMDLQMPDIDGYTATRRIREMEKPGQHTLIVALTASIAKGTREKCLAVGMDDYLTKPLDLKKFRRVLTTLLAAKGPDSPPLS